MTNLFADLASKWPGMHRLNHRAFGTSNGLSSAAMLPACAGLHAALVWRPCYEAGRLNLRAFRLRMFRNFSRNRPEMTNLNHQYAIRRVFIGAVLGSGSPPTGCIDSAEPEKPM